MEKQEYIRNTKGIDISDTHFMSCEGAKHHNLPLFYVSNGNGGHIEVCKHENSYYLTQPTMSNYADPIPYSGKNISRG